MITSRVSLPQRFVQWFETNFIAPDGVGVRRDLSSHEFVCTLERYGVLRDVGGVHQLQESVTDWTAAMRTQVTELVSRVDEEPLTQINQLLGEFVETCRQQPATEELQPEADTVGQLIEAEQARIESIREGVYDEPGTERQRLRDLLDAPEKWQGTINKLAQGLKSQAAEIHAWQVISNIVEDLGRENQGGLAPELNTSAMRQFTQRIADVGEAIGATNAITIGSLDCRRVPETVTQMVKRRTEKIAGHSETFRRLPAKEADACLHRMLANISDNKFLSAGVSGGLLGAFAYVASLRDLGTRGLPMAGLISTSDIADFTVRLFVPFMLTMAIFLCIAGSWGMALHADQRRTVQYISMVSRPLLIGVAFCALLYVWVDPKAASLWMQRCVVAMAVAAIVVLGALWVVGRTDGVKPDDKVQLFMVSSLKACARPLGSLLVLIVIGSLLVMNKDIAVLFPSADPIAKLVGGPPSEEDQSKQAHVLETKDSYKPVRIGPKYARLNSVWIVQQPGASWFAVTGASVACVRALATEERGTNAALKNQCTNAKSESPPTFFPDTIAGLSTRRWQCLPKSFEQGALLTMTFANGESSYSEPELRPVRVTQETGLVGFVESSERSTEPFATSFPSVGSGDLLLVFGFANAVGFSSAFNLDLSERRAHVLKTKVLSMLEQRGTPARVAPKNVRVVALGDNVLSGLFGEQDNEMERRAVALVCKRYSRADNAENVS